VWDTGSAASLRTLFWDAADALGYGASFPRQGGPIQDDHVPFLNAGVRALDVIDFESQGTFWHTPRDTMDKLAAHSFEVIGTVLVRVIGELEQQKVSVTGDGIIVVDKPAGWTSHDVVGRMRGIAGTRRVGHLGTLDPLATGVLPVMIGQATRLARFWEDAEKAYEAVVRFGFATSTYDREGEPMGPAAEPKLSAGDMSCVWGRCAATSSRFHRRFREEGGRRAGL